MKILYIMHVNWHWIRQRPHVLADQLATRHELTMLHFAMYRSGHRVVESAPSFPAHALWRVPERIKRWGHRFERLNASWLAHQVRSQLRALRPDLVWVTHPDLEPAVRGIDGVPLVYDCMDDHAAFNADAAPAIVSAERRLVERADLTIFSSQTLARRVALRAQVRHSEVVNNGVADDLLNRASSAEPQPRSMNVATTGPALGYFGTLSHWFDWTLALRLLEAMPRARLLLAGPVETAIPQHPRIRHVGLLPHALLPGFAADCDILLMPFALNTLIEAVDPVKLYEYIALNRPALAPRYAESTRFEPWVHLYRDSDEALALTLRLATPEYAPPPTAQRLQFLAANAWSRRMQQIENALQSLRRPDEAFS